MAHPPSCATGPFVVRGVRGENVSTFIGSGKEDAICDASGFSILGAGQRGGGEGKIYERGVITAGRDASEMATQNTSRGHANGRGSRGLRFEDKVRVK